MTTRSAVLLVSVLLAIASALTPVGCGGATGSAADDAAHTDVPDTGASGSADARPAADVVPAPPLLGPPPAAALVVRIAADEPVATVSERFVSVAVDTSQLVGGHWWSASGEVEVGVGQTIVPPYDFTRPRLRRLAAALAPAYLRIGGSEADVVWYDLSAAPVATPPEPYELVLTRAQWDGAMEFARELGFEVLFTLNAGPGPRDAERRWTPDQARLLLAHAVAAGDPVVQWELGNEINGFPAIHGLSFTVTGAQYAADVARARALVDELHPSALLAGPSSAFWPVAGEIGAVYPDFMAAGGGALLDVITWHWYPQQSRRCPIATRRAGPEVLLEPAHLDEVETWAAHVEALRDTHAPGVPVWLGESGNAQCGGEPGVSDRFVAGLWWLDQLGALARRGQPVVVRQCLSGGDYGLLADDTLEPRPDYWNSLLWKRRMGRTVLVAEAPADAPRLRAWAHCAAGLPGGVAVLVINLDREQAATVRLDGVAGGRLEQLVLTAPEPTSPTVHLNGTPLSATAAGDLPPLDGLEWTLEDAAWVALPPTSYAFLTLPDAGLPSCAGE